MIGDDVHIDFHAARMRRLDQRLEIGVGAKMRVDPREVRHPIAVIAGALLARSALDGLVLENRRQPDGGRAQSLNIVEPGDQAFKVPAMIESAGCRIIAGLERAAAQPALVVALIPIGEPVGQDKIDDFLLGRARS